jgi:hypothetical protein
MADQRHGLMVSGVIGTKATAPPRGSCYTARMIIDPPGPRYYLEIRASTRANPTGYFYQIWEKLDLPWLVRESEPYPTEGEAWPAGEDELRSFVDGAPV